MLNRKLLVAGILTLGLSGCLMDAPSTGAMEQQPYQGRVIRHSAGKYPTTPSAQSAQSTPVQTKARSERRGPVKGVQPEQPGPKSKAAPALPVIE